MASRMLPAALLGCALLAGCASRSNHGAPPGAVVPDGATDPSASDSAASPPASPPVTTRVDVQLEDVSPAEAASPLGNRVRDAVRSVAEACGQESTIASGTRVRLLFGGDEKAEWKANLPGAEPLSAIDDGVVRCLLDGVRTARLHARKGERGPPSVIVAWLPRATP